MERECFQNVDPVFMLNSQSPVSSSEFLGARVASVRQQTWLLLPSRVRPRGRGTSDTAWGQIELRLSPQSSLMSDRFIHAPWKGLRGMPSSPQKANSVTTVPPSEAQGDRVLAHAGPPERGRSPGTTEPPAGPCCTLPVCGGNRATPLSGPQLLICEMGVTLPREVAKKLEEIACSRGDCPPGSQQDRSDG